MKTNEQRTLIETLVRTEIRALLRETPGDAQFVELVGSMKLMGKYPRDAMEVDVPITMVAHNFPGNPEEFRSWPVHELVIQAYWDHISWRPGDRETGDSGGPNVSAPQDWEVLAVDGYEIEAEDAEMIKRYIMSRPDIMNQIVDKVTEFKTERENEEGYQDPREDDDSWREDE